jgi:F-type H+-transporting ATPase subunit epsilon
MATFQLEFVSPEKLLLSRPVEMALLPAADGEMGVLPGHAPMIVALRGGVISVREGGTETEALFVPGGFAEITPTRVTILADEATPVAQLSRADAEQRVREAEKALTDLNAEGTTPERRDAAMARVLSARAMLAVAQAA